MSLTDTAVRLAKPRDRAYRLPDGRGLCLLIQPSGSKWWRLRYRFQGVEKMLSLGTYPDVPLSEARDRRETARKTLATGTDPSIVLPHVILLPIASLTMLPGRPVIFRSGCTPQSGNSV